VYVCGLTAMYHMSVIYYIPVHVCTEKKGRQEAPPLHYEPA